MGRRPRLRSAVLFLALVGLASPAFAAIGSRSGAASPALSLDEQVTAVYSEGFETGGIGWNADADGWEVGAPSGMPASAHGGTSCAATVLSGYYPFATDARLYSPPIALPSSPANGQLWLSFYHWFCFNPADSGWVEISVANGPWVRLAQGFGLYGLEWSRRLVNLSAYAGQSVRVAFHMKDNGDCCQQLGWYVDDVEVVEGAAPAWTAEHFASGIGRWYAENGCWQVGRPASGPASAHSDSLCAGTSLTGWYDAATDSRLVSPAVTLPASPVDGRLWLSYWHWYSLDFADSAWIELSVANGPWIRLETGIGRYGGAWTRRMIDLAPWAGQSVRVAFRLKDNGDCCQDHGWYVDDVEIIQGAAPSWLPETFEAGLGRWSAEGGTWEVGAPVAGEPAAHGGANCAKTVLGGYYPFGADARLISPATTLPASPAGGQLWLSFWHWFTLSPEDSAWVEISVANGPWTRLVQGFGLYSGTWTRRLVDLSAYVGQNVRLALHVRDNGDCCQQIGWFVDDLSLLEGPGPAITKEDFETGLGRWYADAGTWEVGVPRYGPASGVRGPMCAGTVLDGYYPPFADSRLISPAIAMPSSPTDGQLWLSFRHWYSLSSGDTASLEISVSNGPWTRLAGGWGDLGGDWSRMLVDVSAYAGQSVRLAFRLKDNGDCCQSGGWYVDGLEILQGAFRWSGPASFDAGPTLPAEGGWYAEHGSWAIGTPRLAPEGAFDSRYCASTGLNAYYAWNADSRLISPRTTLPASPRDGGLWLSFRHWFAFSDGDSGWAEVSVAGGPWTRLSSAFTYSSGGWTSHLVDLSAHAGESVRLAFRLKDNGDCCTSLGWAVDNVAIVEGRETSNNPEDFENGTRGWYATRGVWQIGAPVAGPGVPVSGTKCAGTAMDSYYPWLADSRLVTSRFALPAGSSRVTFWSWHDFSADDSGWVEISAGGGPWVRLAGSTLTGGEPTWTSRSIPLAGYAGQSVKFAFRIKDNGDCCTLAGWYLDDVRVVGASEGVPTGPTAFSAVYSAGAPVLTWTPPAGTYRYVNVYADPNPAFVPDLGNRVAQVHASGFTDVDRPGRGYWFYKVTVMDDLWRESAPLTPSTVLAAEPPAIEPAPQRTELLPAAPNPFRSNTTLAFTLVRDAHVRLEVFSVAGRCVATLLDEARGPGRWAVPFRSKGLAPGVYFVRLIAGEHAMTRRIVVLE